MKKFYFLAMLVAVTGFTSTAVSQEIVVSPEKEMPIFDDGAPAYPKDIVELLIQGKTPNLPEFEGECSIETLTGRRFNQKTGKPEICRWQGEFSWREVTDGAF